MVSPTQYLQEVGRELRKVTWPTRRTTQRKTLVVIAVSVVLAIYLGLADAIFQRLMAAIIY